MNGRPGADLIAGWTSPVNTPGVVVRDRSVGENRRMSFSRPSPQPRTPTLPQGETVARYGTYLEAQHAVDRLADESFPVQKVTIVGTDLQMVERVLRRLSYPSVAAGGFASGAWFGLFVGLLFSLTSSGAGLLFPAILFGGGFGLLFSVITYSFTRGRRDFTSSSQIVATSYAVLCLPDVADQARQLLREVGGVVSGWPTPAPPAAPVAAPPANPAVQYPPPAAPPAPTRREDAPPPPQA